MVHGRIRKFRIFIAIALLGITTFLVTIPQYLAFQTEPFNADVVVVMLGPDSEARSREALDLITRGYGRYLIVPAHSVVLPGKTLSKSTKPLSIYNPNQTFKQNNLPRFVEGTHVEMVLAKKIIDDLGMNSALFVSSPYHMRRIKIMADGIFGQESYNIGYAYSTYEPAPKPLWFTSLYDAKWILSECGKIVWFVISRKFVHLGVEKLRELRN